MHSFVTSCFNQWKKIVTFLVRPLPTGSLFVFTHQYHQLTYVIKVSLLINTYLYLVVLILIPMLNILLYTIRAKQHPFFIFIHTFARKILLNKYYTFHKMTIILLNTYPSMRTMLTIPRTTETTQITAHQTKTSAKLGCPVVPGCSSPTPSTVK